MIFSQAHKFLVTVELLLGDIPDKATFENPQLKRSLDPYYQLTLGKKTMNQIFPMNIIFFCLAVRAGDLSRFKEVLETFADRFQQEKTWSLIIRFVKLIFSFRNNFHFSILQIAT